VVAGRAAIGDGAVLSLLLAGARAARRCDGDLLAAICRHRRQRHGDRTAGPPRAGATAFRGGSRQRALRAKEFLLLRRDPWLVSQSLMQLLYLVPPALMLWRSFSESSNAIVLITPVIVMAAGQLAGGLAWLTISGEDAADLVATAPLPPSRVTRAKVEVVLIVIAATFAPLIAALAFASVTQAAVTALGVIIATISAAAIQLWFRVQAKRSQFRRRQTSSRLATFAKPLFDRLGRHGCAGRHHRCGRRQRRDDRGNSRDDMENQPAAGLKHPLLRRGRACPGNPIFRPEREDVDAGTKAGHDEHHLFAVFSQKPKRTTPVTFSSPARSMTSRQRTISFSMNGIISAFCSVIGRVPTFSKCVRTRSDVSAACAAAASRSTTGVGVPAGTMIEDQLWVVMSFMPSSAMVGTSGNARSRSGAVVASTFSLPASTCGPTETG
jgi:hypothetical protein